MLTPNYVTGSHYDKVSKSSRSLSDRELGMPEVSFSKQSVATFMGERRVVELNQNWVE